MNRATEDRKVRVFQVATGNVGSEMIKRIQRHADLELIGLHCYSADKVGRDAGEIVGLGPIGVIATGSIEEIIAAEPDCVTFHGVFPDIELYVPILEPPFDDRDARCYRAGEYATRPQEGSGASSIGSSLRSGWM